VTGSQRLLKNINGNPLRKVKFKPVKSRSSTGSVLSAGINGIATRRIDIVDTSEKFLVIGIFLSLFGIILSEHGLVYDNANRMYSGAVVVTIGLCLLFVSLLLADKESN
jgi:hypothetical protein